MFESLKKFFSGMKLFQEGIRIKGTVEFFGYNYDKNGVLQLVLHKKIKNAIVNAGFDFVCDVIGKTAQPTEIAYMAVGTGVAGGASATTLTAETDRQAAEYAHTPGTKTCTFTTTFTSPSAIIEYGLFNAAEAGTMLNTAAFSAITVDSLQVVATLTLS